MRTHYAVLQLLRRGKQTRRIEQSHFCNSVCRRANGTEFKPDCPEEWTQIASASETNCVMPPFIQDLCRSFVKDVTLTAHLDG
jgi:hypothetical protein